MDPSQDKKAEDFRALHHASRILILPNAWDVPSARLFEDAGFPAIATSSATLAASVGYPDGERIPKKELFAIVRKIARTLSVPLSVDIEGGYGRTTSQLRDTVERLVAAGAVGLNVEDTYRSEGRGLRPVEEQADRLRVIRETGETLGVPAVINARTDAYLVAPGDEASRLAEAIRRGRVYKAAGADCLYPMGLSTREGIRAYLGDVHSPINVMVRKGLPSVAELEQLGVKRLSMGPTSMYAALSALKAAAAELREKGTYESLLPASVSYADVLALAVPRKA